MLDDYGVVVTGVEWTMNQSSLLGTLCPYLVDIYALWQLSRDCTALNRRKCLKGFTPEASELVTRGSS